MSLVHRVIVLNKPLKIRGYTIFQWVLMVAGAGLGFTAFSFVPKEWKLGNVPVGLIVGIGVFCAVMVPMTMLELRPRAWWKNQFLYRLKLAPTTFLPHPEQGRAYPDPTIIEAPKKQDQYYVR